MPCPSVSAHVHQTQTMVIKLFHRPLLSNEVETFPAKGYHLLGMQAQDGFLFQILLERHLLQAEVSHIDNRGQHVEMCLCLWQIHVLKNHCFVFKYIQPELQVFVSMEGTLDILTSIM